jgi:hypothetical protein
LAVTQTNAIASETAVHRISPSLEPDATKSAVSSGSGPNDLDPAV